MVYLRGAKLDASPAQEYDILIEMSYFEVACVFWGNDMRRTNGMTSAIPEPIPRGRAR
jgi:hypothetical protein